MDHLAEVRYAKERYVVFTAADRPAWGFDRCADGMFEASGPCPTCKGPSYGPRLADIGSREVTKGTMVPPVDVPCECHCGFDHGAGADVGCGRWWIASSEEIS